MLQEVKFLQLLKKQNNKKHTHNDIHRQPISNLKDAKMYFPKKTQQQTYMVDI